MNLTQFERQVRVVAPTENFVHIVEAWLKQDTMRPVKQCHTAQRTYKRLRDEHRFADAASTVRRYVANLSELSVQILALIKGHGRASVSELSRATGGNRNTIKDHLRRLVEDGQLMKHGAGRGTWYSLSI